MLMAFFFPFRLLFLEKFATLTSAALFAPSPRRANYVPVDRFILTVDVGPNYGCRQQQLQCKHTKACRQDSWPPEVHWTLLSGLRDAPHLA